MYIYLLLQLFGAILVVVAILIFLMRKSFWLWIRETLTTVEVKSWIGIGLLVIGTSFVIFGGQPFNMHFAIPPNLHSEAPDKNPPSLPILNALEFLRRSGNFERIKDISADPGDVPKPITRKTHETVKLNLVTKEVISEVTPGVYNNYWTFNGQTPGPMLRVREGDTVETTLINDKSSLHSHSIDLHAVTGHGGGMELSKVMPGETKTFKWKALQPGLYMYHCATSNVSVHSSHGQYGLILVEPKEGLPKVDREFYIVQGELYTQGGIGKKGLVLFDPQALLDGKPTYVTFNGNIKGEPRMKVNKGERVRIYVGNGGVNLVSSFHIIGEIFDTVYPEAAIGSGSSVLKNVQTTMVPPGGAAIVEFTANVPGKYTLVDHALARMNKGAWSILEVGGAPSPEIYESQSDD